MKKLTTETFIAKAKIIYGEKYDDSKVEYRNSKTKIIVLCPEHGEFFAIPNNFLQGHACPTCGGRQRRTKEVFIERSREKHGDHSRNDRGKRPRKNILFDRYRASGKKLLAIMKGEKI